MNALLNVFTEFFHSTIPNGNYRVAVTFFFLVMVAFGTLLLIPNKRLLRQRANIVLSMVIMALFLMLMAVRQEQRWQIVVGLLPTLMVGYQLFYLWLYHPTENPGSDAGETATLPGQTRKTAEQSKTWAQSAIDNNFNLRTLFTRYGLPAVLLGITGVVIANVMIDPKSYFSGYLVPYDAANADIILRGIRLGAVGAYVYVLLQLGSRTFRHDVTGTVAMWCWVTLVLGPVLAGTVALLWRATPAPEASWWGTGVVLFFAGFAPRRVIAAIEQAAGELLKVGPTAVVQPRLIPLTQIRGIGPQIEERLSEEGITDGNLLASAEPVRLMRNTPFDMRQILSWIDEAILMVTLPRSWQALEEEGITGAIDLASYYDQVFDVNTNAPLPATAAMTDLAGQAKLSYDNLSAAIKRLNQDRQVQTIWSLYNDFTEFGGGREYARDYNSDPDRNNREPVGITH
jgi:Ca2+/Na+ antiporter